MADPPTVAWGGDSSQSMVSEKDRFHLMPGSPFTTGRGKPGGVGGQGETNGDSADRAAPVYGSIVPTSRRRAAAAGKPTNWVEKPREARRVNTTKCIRRLDRSTKIECQSARRRSGPTHGPDSWVWARKPWFRSGPHKRGRSGFDTPSARECPATDRVYPHRVGARAARPMASSPIAEWAAARR